MSPFAGTVEATEVTVVSGAMNEVELAGAVECVAGVEAVVLDPLFDVPHPARASTAGRRAIVRGLRMGMGVLRRLAIASNDAARRPIVPQPGSTPPAWSASSAPVR
jgi:hypothetical protein